MNNLIYRKPAPQLGAYSRRKMLKLGTAALSAVAFNGMSSLQASEPAFDCAALHAWLEQQMRELLLAAKFEKAGIDFIRPCVSATYAGTWPDDCVWPFIGDPRLAKLTRWDGLMRWLTDAIVDLPVVPDRVEFSGAAVLSPGGKSGGSLSESMPLHLPSAWTRYLDYVESFGVAIPEKPRWAQIIQRSFAQVPFSNGLVYSNPQRKVVGFGFHDTIRITGMELMTSLVTYRGLQRAAKLFENEVDGSTRQDWLRKAERIQANLPRLFDEEIGGFVGGSESGRQFSVWGNALAYSMVDEEKKKAILKFYRENESKIFLKGCTRQVAEAGGWNGKAPNYTYQVGGYWATGTGFVLPALAQGDPELASRLSKDLQDHLLSLNQAEWLNEKGDPKGAQRFLASVSMPLMATRSIMERKPLLDYF